MIYNSITPAFLLSTKNVRIIQKNKTVKTRIMKNIFNKMKEDVGMLKPKKHVNKVGRLTYRTQN